MEHSIRNETVKSPPGNSSEIYCWAVQDFIESVPFQVSISPTILLFTLESVISIFVQSNSAVTNSLRPWKYVRYIRDYVITMKIYVVN
jgi:hypothetical protein